MLRPSGSNSRVRKSSNAQPISWAWASSPSRSGSSSGATPAASQAGGGGGGGAVGGDDVPEPAAPFRARGPLHDGCDSPVAPGSAHGPFLRGDLDRSPVDGAASGAGNPGLSSGSGHRGGLYYTAVTSPALNKLLGIASEVRVSSNTAERFSAR